MTTVREFISYLQKFFKGLIYTRHFCTQYCDKNIFLSHRSLQAKVSSQLFIETCGSKLSFYRNIAILCAKISRVNNSPILKRDIVCFRLKKIGIEHRKKSQNSSTANLTYVSIHIRRTDYIHHLDINGIGHSEVNQSYYHNAMQYFKERFEVNQSHFFILKNKTRTTIET